MAKKPVVVVGMGEMGSVFARGLLRLGHPVYALNRNDSMKKLAKALPKPGMVLVAVGESELDTALRGIPKAWRKRLALLQNELLPADYRQFDNVTVVQDVVSSNRLPIIHAIAPDASQFQVFDEILVDFPRKIL